MGAMESRIVFRGSDGGRYTDKQILAMILEAERQGLITDEKSLIEGMTLDQLSSLLDGRTDA